MECKFDNKTVCDAKRNCAYCTQKERNMADISMCKNKTCPRKKVCYRFTAPVTPHNRQAYMKFEWEIVDGDFKCRGLESR